MYIQSYIRRNLQHIMDFVMSRDKAWPGGIASFVQYAILKNDKRRIGSCLDAYRWISFSVQDSFIYCRLEKNIDAIIM